MRLKKSKEEILQQIEGVYPYAQFNNGYSDMSDISPNELKSAIEQYGKECAIQAVKDAMRILLDNVYTQEEFERDLQLGDQKSS
jgi:hypothetical protein